VHWNWSSRCCVSVDTIGENHWQRLPSILLEDNTNAIFLVRNQQVEPRTKHIDVRHHFLRELHEDGSMIVKYTESEKNEADMMTKTVVHILLIRHRNHVRNK